MDLVTGGTGIVGAHVIGALLDEGRAVRALVRTGSDREHLRKVLRYYHSDGNARFDRIEWAEGDLLDVDALRDAMRGVERVFHCAAIVSFDPRDKATLFLHNIKGTANVVDAMLTSGVKELMHVSSTAAIGILPRGTMSDEDVPFACERGTSAYAVSKYEAEFEVQRGIAEGLRAVMVNPCVVIGPGAHGRSSMTIIDSVRKGTRFFTSGSNAVVDARDVANAMLRLIVVGENGGRYLLIGENITYQKLFSVIAKSAGKPAPTIRARPWMLDLAWRAEALRTLFGGRPLITRATAGTASRPRAYDGSKARALLKTDFRGAEEMVRNTVGFIGAQ